MGASTSKTESITETVNNIVNNVIMTSITKNSTVSSSTQDINIECTDEQLKLAVNSIDIYNKSIMKNPNLVNKLVYPDLCSATNINQSAIITMDTSMANKTKMSNEILQNIKNELDTKLKSIQSDSIGYSDTQIDQFNKIVNSFNSNITINDIAETITTSTSNQKITSKGTAMKNVNQNFVTNMMTSAITDKILSNADRAVIDTVSSSGLDITKQNLVDSAGNAISNIFGSMYFVFILIFIGAVFFMLTAGKSLPISMMFNKYTIMGIGCLLILLYFSSVNDE